MATAGDSASPIEGEELAGIIASGAGEGAFFVSLDWFRDSVRLAVGFDPYPGTLNVLLASDEALARWRDVRRRGGIRLEPPAPETCGGLLIPVLVESSVPAAIVVPDVTRHTDAILEVVAPMHLKTHLRRGDGDSVALRLTSLSGSGPPETSWSVLGRPTRPQ